MELVTKCYSCGYEIVFAAGKDICRCEACGRTNSRPKSQKNELELMKYSNERLSFGEFDEAEVGYRKVLQRTPDEHEARWGLLLCKYGVRYVEDTKTGQRLPTCRRALPTSFVAEPDFKLACEAALPEVRAQYEKDGRYIDDIQKEIRRLKAAGEKYDIFLCYKETDENKKRTRDSMLAQNLYQTLTLHGFSVFYAPISLKNSLGANYEAAIYVALEKSKVMLVLATKAEYLKTTWVKSEWTRYLGRIDDGEDKTLIPLYRDFAPDRLPREFNERFLQGLDMGNFSFMIDLETFLGKLLKALEPVVHESVSAVATEVAQMETQIKRGFRELLDGDFDEARGCFEKVLSGNFEHPQANLGMAMIELKVCDEAELEAYCLAHENWAHGKFMRRAVDYGNGEMKALFARISKACKAEQERKAAAERVRKEAERKAAEERAREEAERKAAEERAREEAERKAAEERARKAAERKAKAEQRAAKRKAEEEREAARRKAEEEREAARRKAYQARREEQERKQREEDKRNRALFEYRIIREDAWDNGYARIIGFKGDKNAVDLDIPHYIENVEVVEIGAGAFRDLRKLQNVYFPHPDEGLVIEKNAFANCCELREVFIAPKVRRVGKYAFKSSKVIYAVKGTKIEGQGLFGPKIVFFKDEEEWWDKYWEGCDELIDEFEDDYEDDYEDDLSKV